MRHLCKISVFVLVAALAACNSQKEPAEAATKAARDALNTVDSADMRYAPTEAKNVRDSVDNAEAAVARGAYPLAIQEATGVPERVTKLKQAIEARKTELTDTWTKAQATVPALMTQVTNRLKNGGGLAKADADRARADLESANSAWTEATVAGQSGDVGTAAVKAGEVKSTLVNLATKMKIKLPPDM
jgi:hypothetical protein